MRRWVGKSWNRNGTHAEIINFAQEMVQALSGITGTTVNDNCIRFS
jgi:hypothetical protein